MTKCNSTNRQLQFYEDRHGILPHLSENIWSPSRSHQTLQETKTLAQVGNYTHKHVC